ncbi:LOW QUALITY PROTEIN: ras and EF-hand domain-containing protein-like [Meles meles]|uniref:LOW QUALITY PROTEIN: ras and EF-hand domain-containing protein-like n=1 Tax=Meles meles TaxID=9662 RepID=UPI001E69F84C|nr:LOW QUALITY PROTEIN: ras and EF-hand domain-containing protein-like [Meles meles]
MAHPPPSCRARRALRFLRSADCSSPLSAQAHSTALRFLRSVDCSFPLSARGSLYRAQPRTHPLTHTHSPTPTLKPRERRARRGRPTCARRSAAPFRRVPEKCDSLVLRMCPERQLLALTEQPVFYSKDPGKRYRCSPGSGRYPKSKSPQTRLSQLEPGAEGTAGSGGLGARTTRPSYLAGRSQIRAESGRARDQRWRGPPPARAGAAPPPLPARTFLQAAQPARGGSRCGSRRQQVAPDFPQLPLSQWAARPVAPRSRLGYPRRAGWRYGDREDLDHLRSFFAACDTNRWGRLEREEFIALCAELRVRPAYAKALFQRLDADRDGAITFQEFARGFRGRHRGWAPREPASARASVRLSLAGPDPEDSQEEEGDGDALGAPWGLASAGQPWQDFQARLGKEAKFIPRKEQVSTLYLNINLVEPRLNKSYEHVIRNFIHEIKLQSTEMENLPIAPTGNVSSGEADRTALEAQPGHGPVCDFGQVPASAERNCKRPHSQEPRTRQPCSLPLEEEMDQRIQAAEHKMRKDENQKVKKDLLESQTNIAFLQSKLDALKSDYADQTLNSERDLEIIREYTEDRNSLERQIEILQTANQKLDDSNDSLRSALENSYSKFNRSNISPGNTISRSSPKFNGHSPHPLGYDTYAVFSFITRSSRSSYVDEDCDSLALCDPVQRMNCEVNSLPESCFDSGLSTLRDSNEYDSEVEYRHQRALQRSHGTQESFGDDASDVDVADIRDEEAFGAEGVAAVLDWKPQGSTSEGSIVSSSRKPISALSPQTDVVNDDHKSSSSQKAYKIVLAGDAAVGKSSFLMRLCKNEFRGNTSATLGVDFQMKTLLVDGERTVLQLWDTAGQERFRSIAKSYFRRADGVLLLYDVTCEKSFLNVREWVDMIEDATQESVPIMLVGNKADLRDAAAAEEQKCVPGYLGEKLAMTMGHYSVKPAPKTAQI